MSYRRILKRMADSTAACAIRCASCWANMHGFDPTQHACHCMTGRHRSGPSPIVRVAERCVTRSAITNFTTFIRSPQFLRGRTRRFTWTSSRMSLHQAPRAGRAGPRKLPIPYRSPWCLACAHFELHRGRAWTFLPTFPRLRVPDHLASVPAAWNAIRRSTAGAHPLKPMSRATEARAAGEIGAPLEPKYSLRGGNPGARLRGCRQLRFYLTSQPAS